MKKGWRWLGLIGVGVMSVMLLAGCGGKQVTQSSSSSRVEKKSSSSASPAKKATAAKTLWDANKTKQLTAFIAKWAPTMGQSYEAYDGHTPLKTNTGVTYPAALQSSTNEAGAGTIGWSPSGSGRFTYNVVGIYNYNASGNPAMRITYVFAFKGKTTVVLVDQSNNGNPTLTLTKNADVKAGFDQIAAGKTVATSGSASQSASLDAKTIGVLLMQMTSGDVTQDQFLHVGSNTAAYPYIVDNGTADSQIPYRVSGGTVTYGVRDANHLTSENVFNDHTVSVARLRARYYSTKAQIARIKEVVAGLE